MPLPSGALPGRALATALAPLLLVLLLAAASWHPARACSSIIVGSRASDDGSIFIARSDDGDDARSTTNNLIYHPPRDHPAVFRANLNKLEVELPAPGLAYMALPVVLPDPSIGRNASGEAGGFNSAGVALSATESIYNARAALEADPHVQDTGIIEDAIPSLLLPQATSARHGAELLGALVTQHGAGEAFGVLFADAHEAWYLESASGHHWLAVRVPDATFFASANQGRLQDFDPADTDNVIASPGLVDFAIKAGLYDPASGERFSFFKAFMRDGIHDKDYSYPRVCLLQNLFAGASPHPCSNALRPVFMRPAHGLRLRDVMESMRNHFEGSRHDPYTRQNPDEKWRPMTLLRTGTAHIMRMRPVSASSPATADPASSASGSSAPGSSGAAVAGGNTASATFATTAHQARQQGGVPDGLSVVAYVAWGMSKLSPFIPLYKGLPGDALPPELTSSGSEPDPVSLFWKVRRLQALVFQDWPGLAPATAAAIREFEDGVELQDRPAMEAQYARAVQHGDQATADAELVDFTQDVVRRACRLLEWLTRQAAEALGLPGVPPDSRLVQLLDEAAEAYAFEPWKDPDPEPGSEGGSRSSGDGSSRGRDADRSAGEKEAEAEAEGVHEELGMANVLGAAGSSGAAVAQW